MRIIVATLCAFLSACSIATDKDLDALRAEFQADSQQIGERQAALRQRQRAIQNQIAEVNRKIDLMTKSASLTAELALISTVSAEKSGETLKSLSAEMQTLANESKALGQRIEQSDAALRQTVEDMKNLAQQVR